MKRVIKRILGLTSIFCVILTIAFVAGSQTGDYKKALMIVLVNSGFAALIVFFHICICMVF